MNAARLVRLAALVVVSFVAVANTSRAALINHWMFDDSNGQPAPQLLDSVGGNNGTFGNLTDSNRSSDVPDKVGVGRSLDFNGTNQFVSLNSQIALPHNTNYTVSLWYRGTDTTLNGDWGTVLLGRENGDIWSNLVLRNGYAEYIRFSGGWQHNVQSTTMVADGEWHHIAFVNHSNATADLYIDGVAEVLGATSTSNLGTPYRIDYMARGYSGVYTDGLLDDVRIYSHALTAAEVLDLAVIPVPEPAAFALLGVGAVALASRRTRRNR